MATRPDETAALRDYLAHRDVPCPGCGYNLRGLGGAACPECNQTLELTVRLTEGRIGQLILAIVGLAIGAGAGGLLLLVVIIVSLAKSDFPRGSAGFLLIWLPAMAAGCLGPPLLWLCARRGRAWFRAGTSRRRGMVAALAWAGLLAFVAAFLVTIFGVLG